MTSKYAHVPTIQLGVTYLGNRPFLVQLYPTTGDIRKHYVQGANHSTHIQCHAPVPGISHRKAQCERLLFLIYSSSNIQWKSLPLCCPSMMELRDSWALWKSSSLANLGLDREKMAPIQNGVLEMECRTSVYWRLFLIGYCMSENNLVRLEISIQCDRRTVSSFHWHFKFGFKDRKHAGGMTRFVPKLLMWVKIGDVPWLSKRDHD